MEKRNVAEEKRSTCSRCSSKAAAFIGHVPVCAGCASSANTKSASEETPPLKDIADSLVGLHDHKE
jgi:hypothetical protein